MAPRPEVEVIKYGKPIKGAIEGNELMILELVTKVVAQAKGLCGKDTGQLQNGLMGKTYKNNSIGFNDSGGEVATAQLQERVKIGEGVAGSAVQHDIYDEFGTRTRRPNPHWRPAIAIEANGRAAREIAIRTQNERMRGALKQGQKRETFR